MFYGKTFTVWTGLNATELGSEGPWVYFSLVTCEVILTNDAHSEASI